MSCRDVPITKILPFLYLGNAEDSQDIKTLQSTGIDFVMNVSESAADSPHVITTHYLKIPVRDTTSENIVDWFQSAFDFIGKLPLCLFAAACFMWDSSGFVEQRNWERICRGIGNYGN